jgi:hypothetical protein
MSNPAETYESFLVPAMIQPLIPHLIEVACPQQGERILDVACVRQIGIDASGVPFSLGDADQLTALFTGAGFTDVEIHPVSFTASYADPELAVSLILRSATAAIPSLRELNADEVDALIRAVQEDMAGVIQANTMGERLEVPLQALVTLGRKPATH